MVNEAYPPMDYKTGEVTLTDFDRAIVTHMGAVVGNYSNANGQVINAYILTVAGVNGDIKVDMDPTDPTFDKGIIPYISILSEFPEEAKDRQGGPVGISYEITDSLVPDDPVTERLLPLPYNMRYTINAFVHLNREKKAMALFLLKKFKNFGTIRVKDNLDSDRIYLYENEGGSDITDIIDSAERYPGISISINIKGEIELTDEVEFPRAEIINISTNVKK